MPRITLVGYRGSGKSAVAARLATRLGCSWQDADDVLEREAGESIASLVTSRGEGVFRDLESTLLGRLLVAEPGVLATGGGVILREANRAALRSQGRPVGFPQDDAAPGREHARFRDEQPAKQRRFEVTEDPLAAGRDEGGDRLARLALEHVVGVLPGAAQPRRQPGGHRRLAAAPVADERDAWHGGLRFPRGRQAGCLAEAVARLSASRITCGGGSVPCQVRNWIAACRTNISTPVTTRQPAARASLMNSVFSGL